MPRLRRDSPTGVITVAIIDDNRLMREAISTVLEGDQDLRVIASPTADTKLLATAKPHVVLLSARYGDHEGLGAAKALKEKVPDANVMVAYFDSAHDDMVGFVTAGVTGFVGNEAALDEVVGAVRTVASGGRVLPTSMTNVLFSEMTRTASEPHNARLQAPAHITPREGEVIDLIGGGFSNREIAQRLSLTTHTVKTHVRKVMEKLGMHTRLQIATHLHRKRAQASD